MAYTKTTWVNDSTPALNASNLNKIEQGIETAQETADTSGALQTAAQTVVSSASFGTKTCLTPAENTTQKAFEKINTLSWTDIMFPATMSGRRLNKPDFDDDNLGLLFPRDNTNEEIYIIGQLPHEYILESDIRPHIHWQQSQAAFPTWELDYKWFKNGDAIPEGWTSLTSNTGVFTYTSGDIAQISSFPTISGTGIDTASSVLLMKIRRNDNDVSGDVLYFQFDIHYQFNANGTRTEFV